MIVISLENTQESNKKFWTFIKHTKRDSSGVAPLLEADGRLRDDSEGKAEKILNKQFTSVLSQISPLKLAQCTAHTHRNHVVRSGDSNNLSASPHTRMPTINISSEGVNTLLQNLNPHKAAGPDTTKPMILKVLHDVLSPILLFLFQMSFETSEIPDEWTQANVVLIYK